MFQAAVLSSSCMQWLNMQCITALFKIFAENVWSKIAAFSHFISQLQRALRAQRSWTLWANKF